MSPTAALPKPVTKQFTNDLQLHIDKASLKTKHESLAAVLFSISVIFIASAMRISGVG